MRNTTVWEETKKVHHSACVMITWDVDLCSSHNSELSYLLSHSYYSRCRGKYQFTYMYDQC